MKDYELKPNEVVLYKGNVEMLNKKGSTLLVLTNLNIVFITNHKKFLGEEDILIEIYSVNDIKVYENTPQIKTLKNNVEIYFLSCEKEFSFKSKSELNKFTSASLKLLTGKSSVQRKAEKIKDTIDIIDNTLGIDTIGATKEVIHNGVSNAGSKIVNASTNAVISLGNKILNKAKKK